MLGNTLDAREKKDRQEAELERIKTTLVNQLKNGKLLAIDITTADIAVLLKKRRIFKKLQTPARKKLLADLNAHGVPEDKVRISVHGDYSMVVILP
mgnify:CR=1 FL=1